MAKSSFKTQFLLSNPNGSYTTKVEKQNGSAGKVSVKRLILQSVSTEVQRVIEERFRAWLADHMEASKTEQAAAKGSIEAEVYASKEASKTAGRNAMKRQIKEVSLNGLEGDIEKKYQYAGTAFFRIVARTPYDEDYVMTRHRDLEDKPKYKLKISNGNIHRSAVLEKTYVQHKADNDVVRNDWYIELINVDGTSVTLGVGSFSGISFENVTGAGWKEVASVMKKANGGKEIKDMNIFNMNQRCRQLEFGLYQRKESKEFHKGAKRFHGVAGGYSVQAPRGFVRITQNELANAGRLSDEVPATGREITRGKRKGEIEEEPLGFSGSIPGNADADVVKIVAEYFRNYSGKLFNEKDILASLISGNMDRALTTRKSAEQLRDEAKEKLWPRIYKKFKDEIDREEAELCRKIHAKEEKQKERDRKRQEKLQEEAERQERREQRKRERQEREEARKEAKKKRDGLRGTVSIDGFKDTKCIIPDEPVKKPKAEKPATEKKKRSPRGWKFGTVFVKGKKYCCALKEDDGMFYEGRLKPYNGSLDTDLSGYRDYSDFMSYKQFLDAWDTFKLGG